MQIDDPAIRRLQAQVQKASKVFDDAIAFHETWKPAAYDTALHERIGHSYAANTFLVVRQALRREMLLALTSLWDRDRNALSMRSIANALESRSIVEFLSAESAAQWDNLHGIDLSDVPEAERSSTAEAARQREAEFGRLMGAELQKHAEAAVAIIRKYDQGGACHMTFKRLMSLRNEHLAHRQINPTPAELRGGHAADEEIETFYQDMSNLIGLLMHVALKTSYDPAEAAGVFRRHAKFFWAAVCGERNEGHPNYRAKKA
jgi:AbiU2